MTAECSIGYSCHSTLQPAIALAERGTTVGPFMARRLAQHLSKLRRDPAAAAVFLPDGQPLQEGQWLVQPDLARCLRLRRAVTIQRRPGQCFIWPCCCYMRYILVTAGFCMQSFYSARFSPGRFLFARRCLTALDPGPGNKSHRRIA